VRCGYAIHKSQEQINQSKSKHKRFRKMVKRLRKMAKEEYYCPKCGAVLNDQEGFDPEKGSWSCTECGQELYGDDVYDGDVSPGVMWYCDECGALLNKQDGFSDYNSSWTCTECHHLNPLEVIVIS
jgi:ribosomal protein L37AE/L43A